MVATKQAVAARLRSQPPRPGSDGGYPHSRSCSPGTLKLLSSMSSRRRNNNNDDGDIDTIDDNDDGDATVHASPRLPPGQWKRCLRRHPW